MGAWGGGFEGREVGMAPIKILVTFAYRSRRGRPGPEIHPGGKPGHLTLQLFEDSLKLSHVSSFIKAPKRNQKIVLHKSQK